MTKVTKVREHLVWDGIGFQLVSPAAAARMEAKDLGQDLTKRMYGSGELKRRVQFTGYRAVEEAEAARKTISDGKPTEPVEMMKSWATYRGIVAKHLEKPVNRVTKADVETWWADQH